MADEALPGQRHALACAHLSVRPSIRPSYGGCIRRCAWRQRDGQSFRAHLHDTVNKSDPLSVHTTGYCCLIDDVNKIVYYTIWKGASWVFRHLLQVTATTAGRIHQLRLYGWNMFAERVARLPRQGDMQLRLR